MAKYQLNNQILDELKSKIEDIKQNKISNEINKENCLNDLIVDRSLLENFRKRQDNNDLSSKNINLMNEIKTSLFEVVNNNILSDDNKNMKNKEEKIIVLTKIDSVKNTLTLNENEDNLISDEKIKPSSIRENFNFNNSKTPTNKKFEMFADTKVEKSNIFKKLETFMEPQINKIPVEKNKIKIKDIRKELEGILNETENKDKNSKELKTLYKSEVTYSSKTHKDYKAPFNKELNSFNEITTNALSNNSTIKNKLDQIQKNVKGSFFDMPVSNLNDQIKKFKHEFEKFNFCGKTNKSKLYDINTPLVNKITNKEKERELNMNKFNLENTAGFEIKKNKTYLSKNIENYISEKNNTQPNSTINDTIFNSYYKVEEVRNLFNKLKNTEEKDLKRLNFNYVNELKNLANLINKLFK